MIETLRLKNVIFFQTILLYPLRLRQSIKKVISYQGLIQKEKVGIDGEKVAQIGDVTKKINTVMVQNYDYEVQTSYTLYLFLLSPYYDIMFDLIKKLELCLLVTFIFNKDYIWAKLVY